MYKRKMQEIILFKVILIVLVVLFGCIVVRV